jgi:hypothetical protein
MRRWRVAASTAIIAAAIGTRSALTARRCTMLARAGHHENDDGARTGQPHHAPTLPFRIGQQFRYSFENKLDGLRAHFSGIAIVVGLVGGHGDECDLAGLIYRTGIDLTLCRLQQ